MNFENEYRTEFCWKVTEKFVGRKITVAGWVENIRDHGGITFLDVRDHYGNVQVVINDDDMLKNISKEAVISASGEVLRRTEENINTKLKTGMIEIKCEKIKILSKPKELLPFEITSSTDTKEELRLKYRFLDLRNKEVHNKIVLRSNRIHFLTSFYNLLLWYFKKINYPININYLKLIIDFYKTNKKVEIVNLIPYPKGEKLYDKSWYTRAY